MTKQDGEAAAEADEPTPESVKRIRGGGEAVNMQWGDPAGRARLGGAIFIALGVLVIIWSTLSLASAAYGSEPMTDVAQRRSYNMVKRETHRVWPALFLRAVAGLGLAIFGGAMVSRAGNFEKASPED